MYKVTIFSTSWNEPLRAYNFLEFNHHYIVNMAQWQIKYWMEGFGQFKPDGRQIIGKYFLLVFILLGQILTSNTFIF